MTSTNATQHTQATTPWFVVITLSANVRGRVHNLTVTYTPKVGPQTTREQLFQWALSQAPAGFENATVLFFAAHPNTPIGGER